ncbi:MAG: type II secretion system protein [Chthoniobacterales bacterium]|nr:type II secretion system protein [Chthoniobacterales bacterium]
MTSNFRAAGFTLAEVLVSLAIVGVLASLLVPGISSARQSALQASTASSMRQIGVAMSLFVAEHDGTLPGPLCVSVYPFSREIPQDADPSHLGMYLGPYLGVVGSGSKQVEVKALQCPALSRTAHNYRNWIANYIVFAEFGEVSRYDNRFGGYARSIKDAAEQPIRPKRMAALSDAAARASYLSTADQEVWVSSSNGPLPKEGVFGGKRMWLFLDGGMVLSDSQVPFVR